MSKQVTITLSKRELQLVIDALLGFGTRCRLRASREGSGKFADSNIAKAERIFDLRARLIANYHGRDDAPHKRVGE